MMEDVKLCVVGLGYVGLPLAAEFGRQLPVIGYDINKARVAELEGGVDSTLELAPEDLKSADQLHFTTELADAASCNVYIITVPTPVDSSNRPDFDPLLKSSAAIGSVLKPGDLVIYESTVYPGVTEEVCVPALEQASGLKFNVDFFCGYSPERINPGDKTRNVTSIVKVTSGSTPEVADFVDKLYKRIIVAGTHKASSIRVAEAAKVIENSQRDVNIALMNELAIIFDKVGIDTHEVLEAAGTKWNFMRFVPGLVGGHCIGVDPYYLAYKAALLGYNPELILAARRINDKMSSYVAGRILRIMAKRALNASASRVLILGCSFKEDCPDTRNSKVFDLYSELSDLSMNVHIYDPVIDAGEVLREFGVTVMSSIPKDRYDVLILAVPHQALIGAHAKIDVLSLIKPGGFAFDIKDCLPRRVDVFRL